MEEDLDLMAIEGLRAETDAVTFLIIVIAAHTRWRVRVPQAVRDAYDNVTNGSWGLHEVVHHLVENKVRFS